MTRLWAVCSAVTYAAAVALLFTTTASADTYQIINLGAFGNSNLFGITASGTVVLMQELGIPDDIVYDVFPLNQPSYVSFNPPDFVYDDGTFGCTPTTSAGITWASDNGSTTCNGSHEEYVGSYTPPGASAPQLGVFDGPDLSNLVPLPGFGSPSESNLVDVFLNSSGDMFLPYGDGYYEVVDLTSGVPEPATLLLACAGVLGIAGIRRQKRRARPFPAEPNTSLAEAN